jgi:hypothetical protein
MFEKDRLLLLEAELALTNRILPCTIKGFTKSGEIWCQIFLVLDKTRDFGRQKFGLSKL